jgi:tight adherence protein B
MMLILLASLATAGVVFFTARYFQMKSGYDALSRTEKHRVEVTANREAAEKEGMKVRLRKEMVRLGLGDNMFPFYAAVASVYLMVAAPLTLLGVSDIVGYVVAVPAAVGAAWTFSQVRSRKRRALFNRQLVDLLDQTIAQIEGGGGLVMALETVTLQMPEPIRDELSRVLASARASGDIIAPMRGLQEKYPSRAMDMFISALEIDQAEGHAIAPALKQASSLLKQDFALASEASAEVAQIKYEFWAVAGMIIGLGVYLVLGGSPETREAYYSGAGIIVVAAACANIAVGFWRFNRKLSKLKGDT